MSAHLEHLRPEEHLRDWDEGRVQFLGLGPSVGPLQTLKPDPGLCSVPVVTGATDGIGKSYAEEVSLDSEGPGPDQSPELLLGF